MASVMGNRPSRSRKATEVEVTASPRTLHEHLHNVLKRFENQVAQVDAETGVSVTFGDILDRSSALAVGLAARGLRPGSIALVIGENSIHYPEVLLGVLRTGAAAHQLDPRGTPRELEHALSISQPQVALVSKTVASSKGILSVLNDATCVREILVWGGEDNSQLPDGVGSMHNLLVSPAKSASSATMCHEEDGAPTGHINGIQEESPSTPKTPISKTPVSLDSRTPVLPELVSKTVDGIAVNGVDGGAVAFILSSSGSTGLPKGVTLTHDNILAALELGPTFIQPDDVVLGLSPYFHAFGGLLMIMSLCQGARMVAVSRFSLQGLVDTVERHNVTVMHLVPSVLVSLAKFPGLDAQRMSSLKRVWTGAAQISPLVQATVRERLPGVRMFHSYGMTETTFTMASGECRADKPGSPGTLTPGMECQVVDPETGKPVEQGKRGELCFRGPMVMRGYLGNAEATREALDEEGWLHSGDMGYVDEDGYVFIVERLKDILKFNGHQVSPSELESLLLLHPAVRDAAVIGIPHEFGEAPQALIVLAEGASVTADELQEFLKGKVAPYKMLRGGIRIADSFPKTASGKLKRKKLRTMFLDEDNVSVVSTDDSINSSSQQTTEAVVNGAANLAHADTDAPVSAPQAEQQGTSSIQVGTDEPIASVQVVTESSVGPQADAEEATTHTALRNEKAPEELNLSKVLTATMDEPSPLSSTATTPATPFDNICSSWPIVSDASSTLSTPDAGPPRVPIHVAASVPLPPSDPNSPACVEVPYIDSPMSNFSARSMSICSMVSPTLIVTPPHEPSSEQSKSQQ